MDTPKDLTGAFVEFLEVAIHSVLYARRIYPEGIFTLKKKYNVPIYVSLYPELSSYISQSLIAVKHLLSLGELKQVDICFFEDDNEPLEVFTFNFVKLSKSLTNVRLLVTTDPHLVRLKESFRGFCLKLPGAMSQLNPLPDNCKFKIRIHTTEASSVSMVENTQFEEFLWSECTRKEVHSFDDFDVTPVCVLDSDFVEIESFIKSSNFF